MGIVLVAAFAARAGGVLAATMRPARQRLLLHANCRHGSRAGAVGRVRLRCCRAWAKAFAFDRACKRLKLKHIRTRPYTPKTNGKAERFVQTALREWAYDHASNRHAEAVVIGDGGLEEGDRALRLLVRHDHGEGDARGVVDADRRGREGRVRSHQRGRAIWYAGPRRRNEDFL